MAIPQVCNFVCNMPGCASIVLSQRLKSNTFVDVKEAMVAMVTARNISVSAWRTFHV